MKDKPAIAYGHCHCGCGQPTRLARKTRKHRGWIYGEPIRYIFGHQNRLNAPPKEGFKRCAMCEQVKSKDDFHNIRRKPETTSPQKGDNLQQRCKECSLQAVHYWRYKNPERSRELARISRFRKKFGMSIATYEEMVAAQNNLCAICKKPETSMNRDGALKPLSVDHSHATNGVRGLLCARCNVAIGMLNEDPALLRAAIAYLKKHAP